jgi:hypothetical protein
MNESRHSWWLTAGALAGTLVLLCATSESAPRPPSSVSLIDSVSLQGFELPLSFRKDEYKEKKLPGWCATFISLQNEKKRRPLYVYGWGSNGTVTVSFSNDGGMTDQFKIAAKGEGMFNLNAYSCSLALDVNDFAGAAWIQNDPMPPILLTVHSFANWQGKNEEIINLVNPDRKGGPTRPPLAEAKLAATMGIRIAVAGKTLDLKDTPCKVTLRDMGGYWSMKFVADVEFQGSALGLSGDDAGKVKLHFSGEAFAVPPKSHRAPGSGKTSGPDKADGATEPLPVTEPSLDLDL